MEWTKYPLFVIAGPCVMESEGLCLEVAGELKRICAKLGLGYVFKASFDKANRSSASSYRGPGLKEGVAILKRVKEKHGVPVLTDVHETEQVEEVAKVVDVLQVPAFLARQTDLLLACGKTGRAVNIKKGQFMSPQEMGNAVEKVRSTGNSKVMLTERGTFFGYNRLVNDFTAIAVMKSFGVPVIFDATHSTQQPGGLGNASGGNPKFTPLLARAAVAAGVDGLFIECHPEPSRAKSDAASMVRLDSMERLLTQCRGIVELRKGWGDEKRA
ncbi:MAG TPA: 3-deoxy-8-phosphooctulonate synthase [Tepidisphaeraceae bacterium]|jgi:2-dehydro-3-deoxyphosphooctonate aldolase (KDO 8-P synthase)|nr:3-deoxy-8-phosphooctulonate synthase [Tepidisphaeraceae bacterium]